MARRHALPAGDGRHRRIGITIIMMMPTMMIAGGRQRLLGFLGGVRRTSVGTLGGEAHRQCHRDQHSVRDVVSRRALGVVLQPVAASLAVHRFTPAELREQFCRTDERDAILPVLDESAACRYPRKLRDL
jgi:hypothetical protein